MKPAPVMAIAFGLVKRTDSTELPPMAIALGVNALVTASGSRASSVAEAGLGLEPKSDVRAPAGIVLT